MMHPTCGRLPPPSVFDGLGDLPGLGQVQVHVAIRDDILPVVEPRLPLPWVWPSFPDLREHKWLVQPPSALLTPLTVQVDATTRPLAERTATLPAADLPVPSPRKRKREPDDAHAVEDPGPSFAQARDGLPLALPDNPRLGEVVAAMVRQLVHGPGDTTTEARALGQALCLQLGGDALTDGLRDLVLQAVLRLALPPWADAGAAPGTRALAGQASVPAGGGGLGPLDDDGFLALADFLRGFCLPLRGQTRAHESSFMHAMVDTAARLGIDPLMVPGRRPADISGYCGRGGPLELVGRILMRDVNRDRVLRLFLDQVLRHVLEQGEVAQDDPPDGAASLRLDERERARHAGCVLASLAWLPANLIPLRQASVRMLTESVIAAVQAHPVAAEALGAGLAKALAAQRTSKLDAVCLDTLGVQDGVPPEMLGRVQAAYLVTTTFEDQVFQALLRRVPMLRPRIAGRLVFQMAVADGLAQAWNPAKTGHAQECRLRMCLTAMAARHDPCRQAAMLHGILAAMRWLVPRAPGFGPLWAHLPTLLARLAERFPALRAVVEDALTAAQAPVRLLEPARAKGEITEPTGVLILQVLTIHEALPALFVDGCLELLVSKAGKVADTHHLVLLLRIASHHAGCVTPVRLPKLRERILSLLAWAINRAGQGEVLGAPQQAAIREAVRALTTLYRQVPLRTQAQRQREADALDGPGLPQPLRQALAPLRGTLRQPAQALLAPSTPSKGKK